MQNTAGLLVLIVKLGGVPSEGSLSPRALAGLELAEPMLSDVRPSNIEELIKQINKFLEV
ncbi:MAG: hypothetical protein ACE5IW_04220 [bacterium]